MLLLSARPMQGQISDHLKSSSTCVFQLWSLLNAIMIDGCACIKPGCSFHKLITQKLGSSLFPVKLP